MVIAECPACMCRNPKLRTVAADIPTIGTAYLSKAVRRVKRSSAELALSATVCKVGAANRYRLLGRREACQLLLLLGFFRSDLLRKTGKFPNVLCYGEVMSKTIHVQRNENETYEVFLES